MVVITLLTSDSDKADLASCVVEVGADFLISADSAWAVVLGQPLCC